MANVDDIIKSLIKTVKAIQMYGLTHPSSKKFYVPFYDKVSDFLKENHVLEFQIEQFSILYANKTIYEEKEKDVSIAFRLFRDGIRSINFTQGLEFDELILFLEIISQGSREQDIALNLWEGDFSHINFYVVEEEEEIFDYKMPKPIEQNIDYDARLKEIISRENIDLNASINPDLRSDELNTLKTEISNAEKMSAVPVAIKTFINFLKTEKSQEIIDSLIELLDQCVDSRDFYNARRIVYALTTYPDINPIVKFETESIILGFEDVLNTMSNDIFNAFIAFVGFFSKESIPNFIKLMVRTKRKDRLPALRHRITYIAQGDPTPVLNFLNSKDSQILINAIAVLGLMKLKDTVSILKPLIHHPEPAVRTEIISALENIEKISLIASFLDDEDSNVRIKALQVLTKIRYPKIYNGLLRRIKNKYFRDLEFVEQKEYFSCLVANGGKEVTNHLKKILFKWILFGRKKYRIMRQLSAMALANVGSAEALEILRSGAKKRNKDIETACKMALKEK